MRQVIFSILIFVTTLSYSATFTATSAGGSWTDPGTWVGGVVPQNNSFGDIINIPAGSVVTIGSIVTTNSIVNIYGSVVLTRGISNLIIEDGTGQINIFENGELISNTNSPITGVVIGGIQVYSPRTDGNTVSGPATIDQGGVLPVELIFFSALALDTQVKLTWATATEENFDYFSIERSTDGKNFIEVGRVNGVGESTERVDYDYLDAFPIEGISYYRLRSIDFDGYTEIFDYKMVEVEEVAKDFHIYPNPVEGNQFSLQTNFEFSDNTQLIVYNSMGGVEMTLVIEGWMTSHYLPGLKPGTYLFSLVSNEGIMVKRIMVR